MWNHSSDSSPDNERWESAVEGTFLGVGQSSLSSEVLILKFVSEEGTRDVHQFTSNHGDTLSIENLFSNVRCKTSFQIS